MWHQWLNFKFAKLREYFFCAKKTKITIYLTILLPWLTSSAILESTQERNLRNQCCFMLRVKHAYALWYSPKWRKTVTRGRHFLFSFAHKKYSRSFAKLKLNHWCDMDCFTDCPYYVSGSGNITVALLFMRGSESSQIPSKISAFEFWRWTKVLQVWNDMRASN